MEHGTGSAIKSRTICFGVALCLTVLGAASAQSTFATITGAVTDPNGAIVPGVKIEATHAGTNYKYSAASNEAGQYTLANLLDGTYTLRATAAGFQEFVARDIELSGRDVRRIDVKLHIGQVQQAIEVSAGATLIETENARIGDVKDRAVLTQLPLTLRRTWGYFQLTPTVSKPRGGWYIRFAGSRNRQGDVSFDGASIASIWGGPINGVLTDRTEGYQEMRIDSAGNSAEFAGIGQISIITRAGTNQLHGSAFDYYTTPGMLARNPFSPAATGSVEHVPGGSLGGPVYIPKVYDGRNRTFFYATIEFERFGSPSVRLFNPTVPLAAWRKGDFSGLLPATVVKDPMAKGAPFAGNLIPASRLNPVTIKIQDRFFPLPNYGDTNVFAAQNFRHTELVEKEINPPHPALRSPLLRNILRLRAHYQGGLDPEAVARLLPHHRAQRRPPLLPGLDHHLRPHHPAHPAQRNPLGLFLGQLSHRRAGPRSRDGQGTRLDRPGAQPARYDRPLQCLFLRHRPRRPFRRLPV